jgi:hypothetical protein
VRASKKVRQGTAMHPGTRGETISQEPLTSRIAVLDEEAANLMRVCRSRERPASFVVL